MRRQASNGAKNQSASSGGGEGRGGDGDADFERCVEKGVPKSAEEKKDAVYYKEKYAKAKKRNQKLEKDVERLLEREETAKRRFDEHATKTSSAHAQRIESLERDVDRAEAEVSKTKKRLDEEKRGKEEVERKKKELESQRDELKETLRNERVKFEKDGKLLKFACEDATKELEIVKQRHV